MTNSQHTLQPALSNDPFALIRGLIVASILMAMVVVQIAMVWVTGLSWDSLSCFGVLSLLFWGLYRCLPEPEWRELSQS